MKKNVFENKLKKAIEDLSTVWEEIIELCYDTEIDINDYIVKDYPFNCSFDEIDIDSWKYSILKTIENSQKNIEEIDYEIN